MKDITALFISALQNLPATKQRYISDWQLARSLNREFQLGLHRLLPRNPPHPNPRRSNHQHAMAPPRAPPELNRDAVAEILLRVPPDEPSDLFRVSLVCKPWLRIASDPTFLRRYRAFHQGAPLLGFFYNVACWNYSCPFVPTTAASPLPLPAYDDDHDWWVLDCRHGRVLLEEFQELRCELPALGFRYSSYSALVLCPVAGCQHHDCHGGPFSVVFLGNDNKYAAIRACVYSSETRAWGTPDSAHLEESHGALYFTWVVDPPGRRRPRDLASRFFDLRRPSERWSLLGIRHGFLLLANRTRREAVVWDPAACVHHRAPYPPEFKADGIYGLVCNGAVACAAAGAHGVGDCHLSHFKVVLVRINSDCTEALGCLYESKLGTWGSITSTAHAMAPPPELNGDAIAEILLRVPPDEPRDLFRASLVCKPWLRIASDPAFLRRYRAFHPGAPLLGFFYHVGVENHSLPFVPTTAASPFRRLAYGDGDDPNWWIRDCRHGRVLVKRSRNFVVWDPITGHREELPPLPLSIRSSFYSGALVVCAVAGCDHRDCHGGPFLVVYVGDNNEDEERLVPGAHQILLTYT
ncbi:hypothetical protein HU200_016371 [Digitaria exilis]|uniref:F-box domain-containing protein n=1 Tax=Digitaria exilis TaxID=1010633 RepID=A0A835F8L4_9POAL|nr:hypothetical protein HU200_016371 [Digitaria exilis]